MAQRGVTALGLLLDCVVNCKIGYHRSIYREASPTNCTRRCLPLRCVRGDKETFKGTHVFLNPAPTTFTAESVPTRVTEMCKSAARQFISVV
ncbi:hypothetical protein BGW80DRAFT_1264489 [Lactifluus volemus]|nr:hypothetical protein BGW80DRAFT_1264489 [Lactifluus volemus]